MKGMNPTFRQIEENNRSKTGVVVSQTSRFYDNVKYNTNITTLHDTTTVRINARTFQDREIS